MWEENTEGVNPCVVLPIPYGVFSKVTNLNYYFLRFSFENLKQGFRNLGNLENVFCQFVSLAPKGGIGRPSYCQNSNEYFESKNFGNFEDYGEYFTFSPAENT